MRGVSCILGATMLLGSTSFAQAPVPNTPAPAQPFDIELPKSHAPWSPYRPSSVPEPDLTNSPRLDVLIRDGKLYLSLRNAIELALENNLDLAIARYNLPIADTDVLRTKAGGSVRGVEYGCGGDHTEWHRGRRGWGGCRRYLGWRGWGGRGRRWFGAKHPGPGLRGQLV